MVLLVQSVLFISFTLLGLFIVERELTHDYQIYVSTIAGWLFSIWLTHKHKPKIYQSKLNYIFAPYQKALVVHAIMIIIIAIVLISVKEHLLSLLVGVGFYALAEFFLMFAWIKKSKSIGPEIKAQTEIKINSQNDLDLESDPRPKNIPIPVLNDGLLSQNNLIVKSLYQDVNVYKGKSGQEHDFYSGEIDKITYSSGTNLSLLVLNTRVNDLRKINEAFKVCYDKILPGGYLVICYNNLDDTKRLLKSRFLQGTYYFIYPFHWIFYRVLSKINGLSTIQDWFSKGRYKTLSWVEVWGRLAYCGLEVEKENQDQYMQYIIARKTRTPSNSPNPSFNIIIKLNRVSLYGNIIKIHKLRSMYPYSEFLQKKIFEQNQLSKGGKLKYDPRITPEGKFLRKYWIDELPQILDWFRGEIKLVGIRAMSQHFFSLYSQQYKDLYLKVKPGIISPIFDEETSSISDIEKIEYNYLINYIKKPFLTDWKYFWLTCQSIIKGVRSK